MSGLFCKIHCACNNMNAKVHRTKDGRLILALCDSELLGKVFVEGDVKLDLTTDFYQGEEN